MAKLSVSNQSKDLQLPDISLSMPGNQMAPVSSMRLYFHIYLLHTTRPTPQASPSLPNLSVTYIVIAWGPYKSAPIAASPLLRCDVLIRNLQKFTKQNVSLNAGIEKSMPQ